MKKPHATNKTKKLQANQLKSLSSGFTLMEIMVATVIFAIVAVAMLSLFNYVLKINRRGEALRQASQASRDFVEFLVKEIRNGQIDYYIANAKYQPSIKPGSSPCAAPGTAGDSVPLSDVPSTYYSKENRLGIINTDNIQECFYYGKDDGSYVDSVPVGQPSTFSAQAGHNYTLVMQKAGIATAQILNPPNLRIDNLMFFIRPLCDPYTSHCGGTYANSYPKTQPSVVIIVKFTVKLATGEQVPIYYQTAVSENKYDIPNK